MARWWTNLVDKVWDHLVMDEVGERKGYSNPPNVVEAIDRARGDWMAARAYFDNVTDPDLVDHAIYSVDAAERKYMYLLLRARDMGYDVPEDDLKRLRTGSSNPVQLPN